MNSDYDQIYLLPKDVSTLKSRGDVSLLDKHGINPIFSAPMRGISGPELVIGMGRNNCLGILHRFDNVETRLENIDKIGQAGVNFGVAIGTHKVEEEVIVMANALDKGATVICVDVANGYLSFLKEYGKYLRSLVPSNVRLMCGNVVTKEGANHLKDSGFDLVRVGIGGGTLCSTRVITGVGRNQLSAISDCSEVDVDIISDGGIDSSGKMVKSFAMGADYVMVGTALAYANEADNDGEIYGMASKANHINNNKEIKSIEGIEKSIDNSKKMPLDEIISQFLWGIRSACTYLDCQHYSEIKYKARIIGEFE